MNARYLLYEHPVDAILHADESGCILDRDYVIAHLEIPPGEWEVRVFMARRRARILAAQSWSDGLLDGLPSPILRWFAADCAEHRAVEEKGDDEAAIKAIIAVRLYALVKVGKVEMVAAIGSIKVAASGYDYRDAARAARVAWDAWDTARVAWDTASVAINTASAARKAAMDTASVAITAASAARTTEANWQLDRLACLAGAWALHGEAALKMLWEGLL